MKYRIYIDEVGNSDIKSSGNDNHRFLCLTGVIFNLEYVAKTVQPELEQLKTKYFQSHPDEPIILHRKELVNKSHPFKALTNPEIEKAFNEELLQLLASWDYTVIAVIIDKQELNTNYSQSWKQDPYHYCQEILLERFRLFLDIKDTVGDVMIESRGGHEDMRLKKSFRRLMDNGTQFLSVEELAKRITSKELKVKSKGANISGLQIADLLAHSVRRYAFKTIFQLDDGKQTFSDLINKILINNKFFRYKDKIEGYGIKKLP
jgi:Protein of unknown function (DUF3800)